MSLLQNLSLQGKRGLVVGIANQHSIAWGCAKALRTNWARSWPSPG